MELTQQILDFIVKNGPVTTAQVVAMSGTTKRTTYRHLNRLIDDGKIIREGIPPSVVYTAVKVSKPIPIPEPVAKKDTFIKNDYVAPSRPTVQAEEKIDASQKGFLILLAIVALVSVSLFVASLRAKNQSADTAQQSGSMYSAILRYDAAGDEYYVLDSESNRVVLDLNGNASLKRLVGKTIQLPPAFMEWSLENSEESIETFDDEFEAPQPQL
jgi:hypothetical protein